ncbi:MAG: hypothetical protein AABM67_10745 [Acidobacteriota bacterium]
MKKLMSILCVALLGSFLLSPVSAKSLGDYSSAISSQDDAFKHTGAGVKFVLPAGWKAKPDGEVITVSTPDDALQMVFWVPEEETLDAAVKDLDSELGKTIKNIKMSGKGTRDTHNGMAHYSVDGTGEVDGTTIEWSVDVLAARKIVIILSFAAPGAWEKHSDDASKFIGSIRRIE